MDWKITPGVNMRSLSNCYVRACRKKGSTGVCKLNICYGGRFCFINLSS